MSKRNRNRNRAIDFSYFRWFWGGIQSREYLVYQLKNYYIYNINSYISAKKWIWLHNYGYGYAYIESQVINNIFYDQSQYVSNDAVVESTSTTDKDQVAKADAQSQAGKAVSRLKQMLAEADSMTRSLTVWQSPPVDSANSQPVPAI